ncbi:hypothetical protein ACRE_055060 [Hapsidospora chrysogenum ATCC 11550]|uniref:Uncharacterized protein n=1 Tax=Hapsidospora chrysogenum (strain ATCC 11550 / CBS 779.69 / DSM 880 / IAM 14645 / JCM 23072 / IMI 49137) TaxID=857340 RepID=A0A086T2X3_HAPC1|nr:hypothetical protein ACRE_055060 [Hapsidospora chrysogenum ATCC 11550]
MNPVLNNAGYLPTAGKIMRRAAKSTRIKRLFSTLLPEMPYEYDTEREDMDVGRLSRDVRGSQPLGWAEGSSMQVE